MLVIMSSEAIALSAFWLVYSVSPGLRARFHMSRGSVWNPGPAVNSVFMKSVKLSMKVRVVAASMPGSVIGRSIFVSVVVVSAPRVFAACASFSPLPACGSSVMYAYAMLNAVCPM